MRGCILVAKTQYNYRKGEFLMAEWRDDAKGAVESFRLRPEELVERGGRVRNVIRHITEALGGWAEGNLEHIEDPTFMAQEAVRYEERAKIARNFL